MEYNLEDNSFRIRPDALDKDGNIIVDTIDPLKYYKDKIKV